MDLMRTERILIGVARKYAPGIVPIEWARPGDYLRATGQHVGHLAKQLAKNGSLVLFGDLPPALLNQAELHLNDWATQWLRLHAVFADSLFQSYRSVASYLLERDLPRTLLLVGQARPVTAALASVVAPFIAQAAPKTPDSQLETVICAALNAMAADNIARPLLDRLQLQGGVLLRALINAHVRTLTPIVFDADRYLVDCVPDLDDDSQLVAAFDESTAADQVSMSVTRTDVTPLPDSLPEIGDLPTQPVPPFYPATLESTRFGTGPLTPRPPIPDLPKRDK
jgi:hypothetical protein